LSIRKLIDKISGSKEGEYKEENGVLYRHGQGKYTCGVTQSIYSGSWDMDSMSGKGGTFQISISMRKLRILFSI
jgi:hypothetical protein